ncbi:MAG: septum formation protein Maf [Nitrospira sp.]|nr:septum formation protein Maf [Nitrospira sp.]
MRLILASTSPRRKDLLALLNVPFVVIAPNFQEQITADVPPEAQAGTFALGKAQSCARSHTESLVLGSDTLLAVGSLILGKPADQGQAGTMLRQLRGREHRIFTAVALCHAALCVEHVVVDTVRVWMKSFSDADLVAYLEGGEWQGKAGAYSIQGKGGNLIERIDGDFTAAVGLPLKTVASLLTAHGVPLGASVDELYCTKPYPNWSAFSREG